MLKEYLIKNRMSDSYLLFCFYFPLCFGLCKERQRKKIKAVPTVKKKNTIPNNKITDQFNP